MKNWVNMVDGSGLRYNEDKINLSHIPATILTELLRNCLENNRKLLSNLPFKQAIFDLAAHCQIGSSKYPGTKYENKLMPNWAKGQYFETNINSLERHWEAYMTGETHDKDTGSHHLLSVAWGFMTLATFSMFYEVYGKYDNRTWVNEATYTDFESTGGTDMVANVYTCIYGVKLFNRPEKVYDSAMGGLIYSLNLYSKTLNVESLDITMSGFNQRNSKQP